MKYWMSISNKTNKKYTNILSREKHNFSISKYKLFNYNAFGIRTSESGLLTILTTTNQIIVRYPDISSLET